jgi:hypothetical protein
MASGDLSRPEQCVASDGSCFVEGNMEITVIFLCLIPLCEGPELHCGYHACDRGCSV